MSLVQAIGAFGRNDVKSVRRDSILIAVSLGPILYAMAMWFVPLLTEFLQRRYAFDLVPYHMLLVGAFVVVAPVAVLGALCGLIMLDDKDQRTLSALQVVPVPRSAYPLYRAATTTVVTALSVTVALALTRLVPADLLLASIPITFVSGMSAAALGLLMPVLANNKVEGLALLRGIGVLLIGLPIAPYFLDSLQWCFWPLPTYWPAKAFWLASAGASAWPYVLGGVVYNALIIGYLIRRLDAR